MLLSFDCLNPRPGWVAGAVVSDSESRTIGKFVAQALNLGSTTLGETLLPVEPQFSHLEMGSVTLNHSGLL